MTGNAERFAASKVPQITLLFWVAKLLTTGMGETTWDWFDVALGQTAALTLTGAALVASLVAQLAMRRYSAWVYWTAVVMVSVFGTAIADTVHNDFGVPYTVSTAVLLGAVAAVFARWTWSRAHCRSTRSTHVVGKASTGRRCS